MPARDPLPDGFNARPFAVRDALNAGVTRKRLRAGDLNSPYWGTLTVGCDVRDLRERCASLQSRLPPSTCFSHSTAALLLRAPLPLRIEEQEILHVSTPGPHRALHAKGIIGHKIQITADEITSTIYGIQTTTAARTGCDLSTILSLHDLVAVGDFLIHWRMPLATLAELSAAAAYPGRRGRRLLRRALSLLDDSAESRPESVLRVILVVAGLAVPEVNRSIVEASGKVLARLEAQGWYVIEIKACTSATRGGTGGGRQPAAEWVAQAACQRS